MRAQPDNANKAAKAPANQAKTSKAKGAIVPATKPKAKGGAIEAQQSKPEPISYTNQTNLLENVEAESKKDSDSQLSAPTKMSLKIELETAITIENESLRNENFAMQAEIDKLTARIEQILSSFQKQYLAQLQVGNMKQPDRPKTAPIGFVSADPLLQYMAAMNQAPESLVVGKPAQQNQERRIHEFVVQTVQARASIDPRFCTIMQNVACGKATEEENAVFQAIYHEIKAQAAHNSQDNVAEGKKTGGRGSNPVNETAPTVKKNNFPPNDLNDDFSELVHRQKKVLDVDPEDRAEGWGVMDKEHLQKDQDEEVNDGTGGGQSGVEETGPRKKFWFPWW